MIIQFQGHQVNSAVAYLWNLMFVSSGSLLQKLSEAAGYQST